MTSLVVRVKRGHRGYGLSLVYRGLDKYAERDTGVFVSRVLPGGQSEKYGLRYSNQQHICVFMPSNFKSNLCKNVFFKLLCLCICISFQRK